MDGPVRGRVATSSRLRPAARKRRHSRPIAASRCRTRDLDCELPAECFVVALGVSAIMAGMSGDSQIPASDVAQLARLMDEAADAYIRGRNGQDLWIGFLR